MGHARSDKTSMKSSWHACPREKVAGLLKVDVNAGLSHSQWKKRLSKHGENRLPEHKSTGLLTLFIKQFQDFMVLVLIGAAAISLLLGETMDSLAIFVIVGINAVLGFVQEHRAEKSLAVLKEMAAPVTTVRREGRPATVPADQIVPGDVILLREGDRVPADARLVFSSNLSIDESALTGESIPVRKDADWLGSEKTELADRRNMVYMGTAIVRGRCEAIVVATAMATEIGDIASMIQSVDHAPTPLQRRLEQLGRWLVAACLFIVGLVFGLGVWRGLSVYDMFLTGVSLAVAAIPEGLPAVVTVALALGVQRMIKRHAIVRRLPAVETLGCTTVICSDKTGTLTRNEMTVTKIILADREIDVTGVGYEPIGQLLRNSQPVHLDEPSLRWACRIAGLCNDASLVRAEKVNKRWTKMKQTDWSLVGDPTEGALLVMAVKGGFNEALDEKTRRRRLAEMPFDSDRKRMSVVVDMAGGVYSLVKGAADVVLARCTYIQRGDKAIRLKPEDRRRLKARGEELADDALRVLALAYRPVSTELLNDMVANGKEVPQDLMESELIFVGLAAMMDPPRAEVARAISVASRAGIQTIMVTGDHPKTASAVARTLGFRRTHALTGKDVDEMDDVALARTVDQYRVFARVSPRHKLRIVRALQDKGHVVAMTGDGVNDAPAVKEADIGVAMGRTGTDVTREAAAMVLSDDNYATLVAAIEEGRSIYDNIRKFIRYLLACNVGEVLAMFTAALVGLPLPLLPIQILWVNLVTDGLPAIALGVDPTEDDVMNRPPRNPREGVFARKLHLKIAVRGVLIGLCTVAALAVGLLVGASSGADTLDYARTLAFSTLVFAQLIYVFQCRSEQKSLHEIAVFGNKWLVIAVLSSVVMQLVGTYWPPAQAVLKTVPLSIGDWGIVLLFSGWSQVLETVLVATRKRLTKRVSWVRV